MKILIFGTGSVARVLLDHIRQDVEIVAFVNSDEFVTDFFGYKVITPDQIKGCLYDFIVIASGYTVAIRKLLRSFYIANEKIVSYIFDDAITYQKMNESIEEHLNAEENRGKMRFFLKDETLLPCVSAAVYWKNDAFEEVYKDFVREQTLNLLAKEIERKRLSGCVAELSVYRGDFTVMIQKAFLEYPLYLFDTFEGFSQQDVGSDDSIDNKKNELKKFKDTSAEYVLLRLQDIQTEVIVKKGLFPDTFDLWDTEFVFVSIDVNLLEPVKSSLELFYPRLVKGGYMLVSDYNAPFYEGTRKAVIDFCDERGITYFPIPDMYGSIVIAR